MYVELGIWKPIIENLFLRASFTKAMDRTMKSICIDIAPTRALCVTPTSSEPTIVLSRNMENHRPIPLITTSTCPLIPDHIYQ